MRTDETIERICNCQSCNCTAKLTNLQSKSISASASSDAVIDIDKTYNPSNIAEQEGLPTTSTSQPLYAKRKSQVFETYVYFFGTQFLSRSNPSVVFDNVKKALYDADTVTKFDQIFESLHAAVGDRIGLNIFYLIKFMITNYLEDERKIKCIQEAFVKAKEKSGTNKFNGDALENQLILDLKELLTSNYNHGCSSDIFITTIQLMYKIESSEIKEFRTCNLNHSNTIEVNAIIKPLKALAQNNDEYDAMTKIANISAKLIHDFHMASEEQSSVINQASAVDESNTMASRISKLTNALKSFFTTKSNVESEESEVVALNTTETLESNIIQ